jgi:hypothetical protein
MRRAAYSRNDLKGRILPSALFATRRSGADRPLAGKACPTKALEHRDDCFDPACRGVCCKLTALVIQFTSAHGGASQLGTT